MTESQLDDCLAAVAGALNSDLIAFAKTGGPNATLATFLAGEPLRYRGLGRYERTEFIATWRSLPGCPVKVLTIDPAPDHKGPRRRFLYPEAEARQFYDLVTAVFPCSN